MAESSEATVKTLINLYESKGGYKPQAKIRKASLIRSIPEEQKETDLKEDLKSNTHFAQQSTHLPVTSEVSLALQSQTNQATDDSRVNTAMLTTETPTPKHPEEPNKLRELYETLKISQYDNEKLRSELGTLTRQLESTEVAVERLNMKHKLHLQKSAKQKESEEISKLKQNPSTDWDELRSAQEKSAKEKRMRLDMTKRLAKANTEISDLTKQMEEKEKELLRYQTDHEDHLITKEDLKKEKQLNMELTGHLSKASEKITALVQRLEAVAKKLEAEKEKRSSKSTNKNPKVDSKPKMDQEHHEKVQARKKLLKLENGERGKDPPHPVPTQWFPTYELRIVHRSMPNLRLGYDRARRKKNHVVASNEGTLVDNSSTQNNIDA